MGMGRGGRGRRALAVALAVGLLGACGDDGDDGAAAGLGAGAGEGTTTTTVDDPTTTTTEPAPAALVVLVSNDDGVGAPGIDALVEALRAEPGVEVVVSAPAEDQSGTGGSTTDGEVAASEAMTASGYPAVAVAGFPADAVEHALDALFPDGPPDLVVTGINAGQNLGPIVEISGTVGAARAAARRGIPAVGLSQGLPHPGQDPDFAAGVAAFLEWFRANRDALVAGTVVNINIPTCAPGTEVRGSVEVVTAAGTDSGNPVEPADCASGLEAPVDDIAAFRAGFVAVSDPGLGD